MVFVLLSPAKTMRFDHTRPNIKGETPHFQPQAIQLAKELKKLSAKEIGKLMAISDKLSQLNMQRFADFSSKPSAAQTDLALLAYRGDTYIGLDAKTLSDAQIKAAQKQIGILTGLYGVLQPLDLIQPYRLEMSTTLPVGRSKNLYEFWDDMITDHINALVKKHKHKAVIGCASNEYLSAVDTDKLAVPFINCDFKEKKNGKLQTVGLLAKRARGMMARYVVEKNVSDPEELKKFSSGTYKFDAKLSKPTHFVFTRSI
jgi:hypothetical protein